MLAGKWFEETKVGDTFSASLTVTETHLVLAAGLLGDHNPLHVDEVFASGTRMGGRILHGAFTSAVVSAPAGMYFHGTALAYLEHNCRFKAPVRPGDTLRTTWTIDQRIEKPKQKGGIVAMTLPAARDLAAVGVRVNTICPGIIDTPIYGTGEAADAFKAKLAAPIPFPKRTGKPSEFAHLVRALIENDYMNGETVRFDGAIRFQPK